MGALVLPLSELSSDFDTFDPTLLDGVVIFAPAVFLLFVIVLLFGPDAATTYDREYEQAPPTDTPPAFVPPLLRRAVTPESDEFTATLFDLIRRGYFNAEPVAREGGDDGATDGGAADLELRRGNQRVPLADFEVPVARIFDDIVAGGAMPLSQLRDRIEEQPENVVRFGVFRDMVRQGIESRGWYTFTAARALLLTSIGLFVVGMAGSGLLYMVSTRATFYFGATLIDGAALLFHASWIAKIIRRRRRTAEGQLEAKRWEAFRRYLTDFPRFRDVTAASLDLWERYLVYAISFGLAQRVLAGAATYRLEELSRSPIFALGLHGPGGDGRADVYSQFATEIAPTRARRVSTGWLQRR